MADLLTQRLHVGGITPSITVDHLRDRFRSFGTVLNVEELGVDPLGETSLNPLTSGQPRPFAFLTLQTTQVQLRKCEVRAVPADRRLEYHVGGYLAGHAAAGRSCEAKVGHTVR